MAAPGLWFGKCCKSGDSNWTEPWNPGSLNNQGKGCNGWSPKWWSPPSMLRIGNALPRILDQVYPNSRYNIFSCTRQMAWHVIAIQYNTPEDWAQHTEVYLIFRKCAHNIYIYTHIQFYIYTHTLLICLVLMTLLQPWKALHDFVLVASGWSNAVRAVDIHRSRGSMENLADILRIVLTGHPIWGTENSKGSAWFSDLFWAPRQSGQN